MLPFEVADDEEHDVVVDDVAAVVVTAVVVFALVFALAATVAAANESSKAAFALSDDNVVDVTTIEPLRSRIAVVVYWLLWLLLPHSDGVAGAEVWRSCCSICLRRSVMGNLFFVQLRSSSSVLKRGRIVGRWF